MFSSLFSPYPALLVFQVDASTSYDCHRACYLCRWLMARFITRVANISAETSCGEKMDFDIGDIPSAVATKTQTVTQTIL